MNYGQLARLVIDKLRPIYGDREAKAIQTYFFKAISPIESHKWLLIKDEEAESEFIDKVIEAIPELMKEKPVQYVVGKAWFNGLEFKVTPDVLIPRGETEELIKLILKSLDESKAYNILDIGTGSGAIAVSIALHLKNADVSAMDISTEALEVAKANALKHDVRIKFLRQDILEYDRNFLLIHNIDSGGQNIPKHERGQSAPTHSLPHNKEDHGFIYDIIISNPPYVKESEKALMSTNVLQYEPDLALFVKDNDPLLFYRAILNYSLHHLKKSGRLWFEINENHSRELVNLMREYAFDEIMVYQDLNDKDRYISGLKIA